MKWNSPIRILLIIVMIPLSAEANHTQGGEITWECVSSGSDKGKVIFRARLFRACYPNADPIPTTLVINNPLYGAYGGPSSISAPVQQINDLARPCHNPNAMNTCGTSYSSGNTALEEYFYESDPVHLKGTPASNGYGSSFWVSICCRGSATLTNATGAGLWLRATMFPYYDSSSSSTLSLGDNFQATCYESSPHFAARPVNAVCINQDLIYQYHAFDPESDSLSYSWTPPMQSATNAVAWRTGYTDNLQYPNQNHDSLNIDPVLNTQTGVVSFKVVDPYYNFTVTSVKVSAFKQGQKVAEVYREMALVFIDCDTIITTPQRYNNSAPSITFKPQGSSSYSPSLNLVHPINNPIEIDIRAVDSDINPSSPAAAQSVYLEVQGSSVGDNIGQSANCLSPPCAYLDSNSTYWIGNAFKNSILVDATFKWTPTCENFSSLEDAAGSGRQRKVEFMARAFDDWCPASKESVSFFTITIVDTSQGWVIDEIDGRNGILIQWPKYNGSGFVSYDLFRSIDPNQFGSKIRSETNVNVTSYTDAVTTSNIRYYYKLKLNSNSGCVSKSLKGNIDLDVSQLGYYKSHLTWNSPYASLLPQGGEYFIYRRENAGPWSLIDSIGPNNFQYTDSLMAYNEWVEYYVYYEDNSDFIAYSDIDSVFIDSTEFPPPPPPPPSGWEGIDEHNQLNVEVYPNPAMNEMFVKSDVNSESIRLKMYSSQGLLTKDIELTEEISKVNVSNLNSGIYFLEMQSGDHIVRKKVIVRE